MDPNKIPLLVKFTKQIHNSLEGSSNPKIFNTVADIKYEIDGDDFLSLYLSKLNGSETLYLFFSIYYYHMTGDVAKSVKYVLENLKGYQFFVYEESGYLEEDCSSCDGSGKEACDNCDGQGNVICRSCDGDGKEDCSTCDGTGEDDEGDACGECGGSGNEICNECDGRGDEMCYSCDGDGEFDCNNCDGRGNVETDVMGYDEFYDKVYTTNKLGDMDDDIPFEERYYNSVVLKQPFLRERNFRETYSMEDIEYDWNVGNQIDELNDNNFVFFGGKLLL
jgi:hypothetical protein